MTSIADTSSSLERRLDAVAPTQIKDLVYRRLRDALIDHEYAPGESMREIALSRRYGVSKTPIREALVRLEQDGLVEIVPCRGAHARVYTAEDARELFEAREILESECVRLAGMDAATVDSLRDNVARTRVALDRGDLLVASAELDAFDDILFSLLRNNLLSEVIERMSLHLRRLGKLATGQQRFELSLEQHEAIVEAIEAGEIERAQIVLRSHLGSIGAAQAVVLENTSAAEQ